MGQESGADLDGQSVKCHCLLLQTGNALCKLPHQQRLLGTSQRAKRHINASIIVGVFVGQKEFAFAEDTLTFSRAGGL